MRKICVITGSRADASPLAPVIAELKKYEDIQLIHLETEGLYGHERVLRVKLKVMKPDIVVLLGDRYETLISAIVVAQLCIPIAHLSGGDITTGAVDDAFRHAITKLAYWHFPICKLHGDRIYQMGENPEHIFTVGCPGVDMLTRPITGKACLESQLKLNLSSPLALVCYHPETLSRKSIEEQFHRVRVAIQPIINAGGSVVISGSNKDTGGAELNKLWPTLASQSVLFNETFHQDVWRSLMHYADVLIGNSSGFIIEGMTLGKEYINIGDRQKGRYEYALGMFNQFKPGAITWIDTKPGVINIVPIYPFGRPGMVSPKIASLLATLPLPETTQKVFNELGRSA